MWLDEDTESALQWIDYQRTLCSGCGNPAHESMDPAMDGAYEAVPLHCFACAARDAENRAIADARSSESHGTGSFDGLYVAIRKNEPPGG